MGLRASGPRWMCGARAERGARRVLGRCAKDYKVSKTETLTKCSTPSTFITVSVDL